MDFVKQLLKGDKLVLAQAISTIENNTSESIKLLDQIYSHQGRAVRLGITGPPGVGKSTLINELIINLRKKEQTVGVLAIDPSSVFTGGAILGDRIRMQQPSLDEGVFIRSMATRGCLGGLAQTTSQAADLLDASGKDYVLIETVGVGQTEIDINQNVDITIVILSPEFGDVIQAMKAGVLEVADLIVVNKADRPGVDMIVNNIRQIFELRSNTCAEYSPVLSRKNIPILKTEAHNGTGIPELLAEIEKTLNQLKQSGTLKKRREIFLAGRLKSLVNTHLEQRIWLNNDMTERLNDEIEQIKAGKQTPYRAAEELTKNLFALFKSY